MGFDTKMLCKALSNRLDIDDGCLKLVSSEQKGFVMKSSWFHNIRRALNVLYERYNAQDTAMLSVDAHQAFDRMEWDYSLIIF